MQPPEIPKNESQRLQALQACRILDTVSEERFDRLTRLAKTYFNVPIALISLVDSERQWFKSKQGFDAEETSRDISFCGHAILQEAIFTIPNALEDARFADNPLVTGDPEIRFYAGAPLTTQDGCRIGTLCLFDSMPRELTDKERATLRDLADCVQNEINQTHTLEQAQQLSHANRLNEVISRLQQQFIRNPSRNQAFDGLLSDILKLTSSEYGFIGEVRFTESNTPYLKTYALAPVARDDQSREFYEQNAPEGLEFTNLDTLYGAVMTGGKVVISNSPRDDPRSGGLPEGHPNLDAFLGLPVFYGSKLVAMIGLANRPGGYDEALVHYLDPLLVTLGQLVEALRIQSERQTNDRRLKSIIEGTRIGTWEWNIETGKTVINEYWAEIIGYPLSELQPISIDTWMSFTHPDDQERARALLREHFSGELEYYDIEYRMRHKDGHWVWVHDRGRVYSWSEDGRAVLMSGTHADITEQKNEKLELNRISHLLGNVMDAAYEYSIIGTDINGMITIFNYGAERMLGYRAEEMIAKQSPALIHLPAEVTQRSHELTGECGYPVEGFRVFVEKPEKEGSEKREWTYVHKDGHHIPVSLVVTTMRDEAGRITGYLGIAENITARIKAEEKLRLQAAALNAAANAIVITDNKGFIQWTNPAWSALTGYQPEEAIGKTPNLVKSGVQDNAFYDDLWSTILAGRIWKGEIVNRRKNGSHYYEYETITPLQDESGHIVAFIAIKQDISEQKRVETALRDQAEQTQAILDNINDGIITINKQGVIEAFNPSAESIFGYDKDEVLGNNVKMLMPNPYRDEHDNYLHNYLTSRVPRIIGIGREVQGLRKDGSLFPMDLSVSEITRQGETMFVGLVRDITERKRIEQMKSEFVSTVSHELRTPLTSLSGALGLVTGGALGDMPEKAKHMLDIAHKNSQRLTYLINDLLDMEKLVAGKMHFDMQVQPLLPLVEQALETNRSYGLERNVKLKLEQPVPQLNIRVDAQRLMQVFSNLLSNAIKYSPDEGTVTVSATALDDRVRIKVIDLGSGIPKDFHDQIFQKFSQADSSDTRKKSGTGLGLAISRELVERMGGRIDFESEEGKGSCFFFDLPVADGNRKQTRETVASRKHILVVEDEPDIAKLLALMLERADYAVDIATTGREALDAIQSTPYAAVTLDLMLPDISGLDVITEVRKQKTTEHLPIIVVSAKMEEGRLSLSSSFEGIEWLAKPVDENHLLDALAASISLEMNSGNKKPRILHVEDDKDLHQVISAMVGHSVIFELATGLSSAKDKIEQQQYDVIILDLMLPDGSGIDLIPLIRSRQKQARIVILSAKDPERNEARQVETVLLKSRISPQDLLNAIKNNTSHPGNSEGGA